MKVLIDGCGFGKQAQEETADFWRQVIPLLVNRLRGHQVYYLNRYSNADFQEIRPLINLLLHLLRQGMGQLKIDD